MRVSFISQPGNRWSGQTGDAHSPAAIVLQPSCPKSPVMNKGSLSEQHLLQPLSSSVLQMSFGRDKSAFLSGRYWIREAKKAGVIFNLFPPCVHQSVHDLSVHPRTRTVVHMENNQLSHSASRRRTPEILPPVPQQLNDSSALSHFTRMLIGRRSHIDCPDGNRKSQRWK